MLDSSQTTLFAFGDLREELSEYGYDIEGIQIMTPLIPANIITEARTSVSDPVDLLYVGRLAGEKGLYDLVEAVHELRDSGVSARLHIVGDGPESKGLPERVADIGLHDEVTFYGFVSRGDALWSKFDKADVFVLPSYTEGFPRVIGEAMARGLPIVTTNVGGIPDLIDDGRNGILVEPGAPSELSEQIQRVVKDETLYTRLSENAIETAKRLTFEREAEEVVERLCEES